MSDIIIRLVELPPKVNGVTIVDENGDNNIYINARLSYDEAMKAIEHEMSHIVKEHHYNDGCVTADEAEVKNDDIKLDKVMKRYTVL